MNNPLYPFRIIFPNHDDETVGNHSYVTGKAHKLCTIQSTNTAGDALYIVQFNVVKCCTLLKQPCLVVLLSIR